MKKGQELITELENRITMLNKSQNERETRIANHETDEDDCFRSIYANKDKLNELKTKIEILKNGGTAIFEALADLDGNIIENARLSNGQYGDYWNVDGKNVSTPKPSNRAGKKVWVSAGFKNHSDARAELMYNDDDDVVSQESKKLYRTLYRESIKLGYEAKGYMIVDVDRPAWVTMSSNGNILRMFPVVFETEYNYFTGK